MIAPEYVTEEKVENANDMFVPLWSTVTNCPRFSLGCVIVAIHNKGRSLINSNQNIHTYRQQIAKIESLITSSRIPSYLQGQSLSYLVDIRYTEITADKITSWSVNRICISAFPSLRQHPHEFYSLFRCLPREDCGREDIFPSRLCVYPTSIQWQNST